MLRTLSLVTVLALFAGCGQSQPQPPPGYVVGPNGVLMPAQGVTVGPGGITAPGVTVGPGGITAPGVTVGPGGVTAPGVSVAVPTPAPIPTAAPAADAPPSTGIPECDAYAQRACSCSNEAARAMLCQAARSAVTAWQGALSAGADRATITQSCQSAAGTLAMTCP